MLSGAELDQIREDHLAESLWRNISCHVIADMLEVCAMCGAVRDRARLVRCPVCDDCYYCADGPCFKRHHATRRSGFSSWGR